MAIHETPVLVVGAGLAGLSTAVFLGAHGVPALVVDRHPGTSTQPKARGQNPTVMEALGSVGLTDRILAATPPGRPEMTIVIADSVTGTVIHSLVEGVPDYSRYSPAPHGMASQEAAEAALAARAVELGAQLRFGTNCEGLDQDDDEVTATLRDVQTGAVQTLRASYVVAADGHRGGLRDAVGITSHGRGTFEDATTTWRVRADLSGLVPDTAIVLYYLQNPALPGRVGMIVSTDNPGEWVAGMVHDPQRSAAQTVELVRRMIGVADLDVELLGSATWQIAHRVADSFRAGRVLLVGDAAHVMPPTGGQGGNCAVLDGYHLGWKLAAVVRGQAGAALLDSHDAEQRPFAQAVADWQMANMVIRLRPDLADDSISESIDGVRLLFGYRAPEGAFISEPGEDAGELFVHPATTSGEPGMRVPHVELRQSGTSVSPRELLNAHFLVLTGSAVMASAAPGCCAALGVRAMVHEVGPAGLADPDGEWAAASGVGPEGTVLVRPDGVVAWRSTGPAGADDLDKALRAVLAR
jgi:2-polyprenyl-6-methoxyphenol hydroxylase-like FAD-dependent oxidoreductase